MEIETMGRVTVEATFENSGDVWNAAQGLLAAEDVRKVVIPDVLIDTGATLVSLPTHLIRQLGLTQFATKKVISSVGLAEVAIYAAVRLTIMGRTCTMDVTEVPDGVPALIGQIPLEHLDFVVDLRDRKLIGNPAHGGEHIYEMF